MNNRERVVVAMSGGVDSSAAAALLLEQGYQVVGMMMRLWSERGKQDSNRCCTPDAMAQARRVAALLEIPFYVIDAQEVFHAQVVEPFLDAYAQGVTPNPCLICNRSIRWEFLLQHALDLGASYMATGHYARIREDAQAGFQILRAVDPEKDQSYVLHVLDQARLAQAKFPVGDYPKSHIRLIAQSLGLPTAQRPDSQDLCFLADSDLRQFLLRNAPQIANPGPILRRDGQQLGQHQGLGFYTIGQRKGLGIAAGRPLYVLEKDLGRNALIVGEQHELGGRELTAGQVNWVSGAAPLTPLHAQVKIRYTAAPAWGVVSALENGNLHIRFDEALRDITPGQAAVIYDDDVCLGGGMILA